MECPIPKPTFLIGSDESLEKLTHGGLNLTCDDQDMHERASPYNGDSSFTNDDDDAEDENAHLTVPAAGGGMARSLSSPSLLRKRYEEHKKAKKDTGAFISGEVLLRRAQAASNIQLKVETETEDANGKETLGSSPLEKGTAVSLGVLRSVSYDVKSFDDDDGDEDFYTPPAGPAARDNQGATDCEISVMIESCEISEGDKANKGGGADKTRSTKATASSPAKAPQSASTSSTATKKTSSPRPATSSRIYIRPT